MFGMRLRERGFVSNKIKRGPHKDRKGWFGIDLRPAHPDPEDSEGSSDEPSDGAGTGAEGPLGESRSSKPDSSGGGAQSGPKSQNPTYQPPRVEKDSQRHPHYFHHEPWELAHGLFCPGYVEDLPEELKIEAAVEVARQEWPLWSSAA